jgi:hypothetical protein
MDGGEKRWPRPWYRVLFYLKKAEAELLAAACVPGSPQLASFGPKMQLALELLQAGRRECVLEYFALCAKFWEMGERQLHTWTDDIKSGREPKCGGNLFYQLRGRSCLTWLKPDAKTVASKARFLRHRLAPTR